MNNLKVFLIILLIFFVSCKKENHLNNDIEKFIFNTNSNCIDTEVNSLPEPSLGFIFNYNNDFSNLPYFNPNNPDEFLYYNQYGSENIYIFNRKTNSKKILTNSHLLSPPKWGKNGWILLDNGTISIIKENGDSLQQICKGYNPEWNYEGTQFAYENINWNIGKAIGVIYNLATKTKDTLPFMLNAGKCWQNKNNKIIFFSSEETMQGFTLVDLQNRTRTLLNKFVEESPSPPCWINENEFVYSINHKIYTFNINTRSSKVIAKLCSNENIGYMSYSPISKEVITSIDHWKALDEKTILITSKIMILNFNDSSVSFITP